METSQKSEKMAKSGSKRSFDIAFLAGSSKISKESDKTEINQNEPEKSAFTKYKDRKICETNEGTESVSVKATPLTVQEEATPTLNIALNHQSSLNMLQFPALRKLLDITGESKDDIGLSKKLSYQSQKYSVWSNWTVSQ